MRAQAARWASGPVGPLPVSVNLSGSELRHGQPLRTIREALASSGLDPRLLGVEICENALLEEAIALGTYSVCVSPSMLPLPWPTRGVKVATV